ncbi:hypothetical protein DPQ33_15780 [Oceanidesulfovibrio indonesiensis]|uniref:Cysteine-rich domain-containing protein n=1 Tax=Oceanidesulfovibrio indonesiensis TaxID=54767 RepID=A0A7M3MAZ3_9BACT|nr:CoB--CoM heterodisulfide reductase iron-sulfur subunit B family protein [Oceanidesulfovibrio indonesiensis]TVM15153.1 hypothetical protein DPQ33_15780 [Oceanidesulfovibrio indonesiensis]
MAYAMFRCCVTANHLPEYDDSADALLAHFGIEAADVPGFGCCGYPLKNLDIMSSLAASARNLSLAERAGRTILTTCACCYGTLRHSARLLEDRALLAKVNEILAAEGLCYRGGADVRHLFHVLDEELGIERIEREAGGAHAFRDVAVQYGCKLLRPSLSVGELSPRSRSFFEELVSAAGSSPAPWGMEKECCGSAISTTDIELSDTIGQTKMAAAKRCGADGIVAACPFCMLQLREASRTADGVPVLSVSQLLCLALGIETKVDSLMQNAGAV